MLESQSCGWAIRVGAKNPRPVVTASSATIAFSGKSAAIDCPSASDPIAPEAGAPGRSLTTGAGVARAPTSSHSISSASTRSSSGRASTCPSHPSGVRRLGLSG